MSESNIRIKSNVYIRRTDIASMDREYIGKVTGPKLLHEMQRAGLKLSREQERSVCENASCSCSKNTPYETEKSFGLTRTLDGVRYACRCENKTCKEYDFCIQAPYAVRIEREHYTPALPEEKLPIIEYTNLRAKVSDGELIYSEPAEPIYANELITSAAPAENAGDNSGSGFIGIRDPECIICANADSHILLNSGPGTGKTYTIIQRILYMLENGMCAPDEIVVLCYTRAARNVVAEKIIQQTDGGELPFEARNIGVFTFDSYASYFLYEIRDELGVSPDSLDYNERIRIFTEKIQSSDLNWVKYLIVDEIQDLVNERAKMILRMIEITDCGLLLCGDRCQAIYDYEAEDNSSLDSTEFWKQLDKILPDDTSRYEITSNHRQTKKLAELSASMRDVILNGSIREQNSFAAHLVGDMVPVSGTVRSWIDNSASAVTSPTALLCRSNGEAMNVDALLCAKRIPHRLLRSSNDEGSLSRWIGDVMWDHCEPQLTHTEFVLRYTARISNDLDEAEHVWQLLCSLCSTREAAFLEKDTLIKALGNKTGLPKEMLTNSDANITVSTIHKAKGSEYDNVFILASELKEDADNAEEARTRYVALTRAKKNVTFLNVKNRGGWYFRKSSGGRPVRLGKIPYKKAIFCSGIPMGLPGDIDCTGFVCGNLDDVLNVQEYISSRVKKYDPVTVKRCPNGRYAVFHKNTQIGILSDKINEIFGQCVDATDYRSSIPFRLNELFISDIITEVFTGYSGEIPEEFRKSRIWLGVEITGIGKTEFKKG